VDIKGYRTGSMNEGLRGTPGLVADPAEDL
jgi:hypothetical protein